jgi:nucleotide-binding universal stress UspA family protein
MDQAESSPSRRRPSDGTGGRPGEGQHGAGSPAGGQPAQPGPSPAPAPEPGVAPLSGLEVHALRRQHPVIAGYDGSASSRNALAYAAGVSMRLGRPLLVVYVCSSGVYCEPLTGQVVGAPRDADALERWLLAELDQVTGHAEVDVHVRTRRGSPARELAAAAEEFNADALVIGAPKHFWHRIMGSVPGWLARHARCPVIVVPLHKPLLSGPDTGKLITDKWARRDLNPHVLSDTRT